MPELGSLSPHAQRLPFKHPDKARKILPMTSHLISLRPCKKRGWLRHLWPWRSETIPFSTDCLSRLNPLSVCCRLLFRLFLLSLTWCIVAVMSSCRRREWKCWVSDNNSDREKGEVDQAVASISKCSGNAPQRETLLSFSSAGRQSVTSFNTKRRILPGYGGHVRAPI